MQLPGKDFLKKAFLVAAAGAGLTSLTGCAVTMRSGGVYGGIYIPPPPPPVYVEPYPVYPVHPAPVIVFPGGRGGYHHGGGPRR